MLDEFKNFAFKGNAFDLAVGVIIGGAFGKIVGSIVDDLIMPVIGALFGGLDFNNYFFGLSFNCDGDDACRGKGSGRYVCLWQLHHCPDQFPDHRLHSLPTGEGFQPDEEEPKSQPRRRRQRPPRFCSRKSATRWFLPKRSKRFWHD